MENDVHNIADEERSVMEEFILMYVASPAPRLLHSAKDRVKGN